MLWLDESDLAARVAFIDVERRLLSALRQFPDAQHGSPHFGGTTFMEGDMMRAGIMPVTSGRLRFATGQPTRATLFLRQRVSFGRSQGRFPSASRSQKRAFGSFSSAAFALTRSALICSCIEGSSLTTGSAAGGPSTEGEIASTVNRTAMFIAASYRRA